MSDQFPPAPPPPPPAPPPPPQNYGYQQPGAPVPPPVKTGMSGGLKALLIIVGIFTGLGILTVAGFLVVGALVVNEANEIATTAASDFEDSVSDFEEDVEDDLAAAEDDFASDDEEDDPFADEEEDDTFASSGDDADLATWCSSVDEFDELAQASTDGFTVEQLKDKILTLEDMIIDIDETTPSEFRDEADLILSPFAEMVIAFRAVDFDPTQITSEDQASLQEGLERALPSVLTVRQACLNEGVSAFEQRD